MKEILLGLSVLSVVATGCSRSGTDSTIAKLKETNVKLSAELAATNKRLEENETSVAAMEATMNKFTQGFDSEKRQHLAENIEAIEGLRVDIRQDTESAKTTLQQLKETETTIERLKNLCVKHEAQAKDANQIGQLKASVATLKQSVSRLERSIGPNSSIRSKFQQLESKIRQLELKTRQLNF